MKDSQRKAIHAKKRKNQHDYVITPDGRLHHSAVYPSKAQLEASVDLAYNGKSYDDAKIKRLQNIIHGKQ